MALCRTCHTVIPCHCHLPPPIEVRPGVYATRSPHAAHHPHPGDDMTQPLDLNAIETRRAAATPGPWGVYQYGGDSLIEVAADLEETGCGYRARRTIARFDEEPLDNDPTHREWTAEEDWAQVRADAAFIAHAREDVDVLVAEVRRLTNELADQQAETEKLIRWRREDETAMKQMRGTIERLRGEKRELGELAARRESELIARRAALEEIRHLHKDSPMGPCPVCIDADAVAAGGDGLVPYPCPTGRLAGAQDCDPPRRATLPA